MKKRAIKILALCVALVMGVCALVSCGFSGPSLTDLNKNTIKVDFENVVTGVSSSTKIYEKQISLVSGQENSIEFTVDAPSAGLYRFNMDVNGGTVSKLYLQNTTEDKDGVRIDTYVSHNTETCERQTFGGTNNGLYANLVKGENTLSLYSTSGDLVITSLKATREAKASTLKAVSASSVFTQSAKITSTNGTRGLINNNTAVVILGGQEYSDAFSDTITVDKTGAYKLGLMGAGEGSVAVTVTTIDGEVVYDVTTSTGLSDLTKTTINGGRSGATGYVELGSVALQTGVTYTVTVTTTSWATISALVLSN